MLLTEALLDQVFNVVYTFRPLLAAGNISPAALPAYLAYLTSTADPGYRSERRAVRIQSHNHVTRQDTWRVTTSL
jgi:hypothetical protein